MLDAEKYFYFILDYFSGSKQIKYRWRTALLVLPIVD